MSNYLMSNYFYDLPQDIHEYIYKFLHKKFMNNITLELNLVFQYMLKIENLQSNLYTVMSDNYDIELIKYYKEYILIEKIERYINNISNLHGFNNITKKILTNHSIIYNMNNPINKLIKYLYDEKSILFENINEYINEINIDVNEYINNYNDNEDYNDYNYYFNNNNYIEYYNYDRMN